MTSALWYVATLFCVSVCFCSHFWTCWTFCLDSTASSQITILPWGWKDSKCSLSSPSAVGLWLPWPKVYQHRAWHNSQDSWRSCGWGREGYLWGWSYNVWSFHLSREHSAHLTHSVAVSFRRGRWAKEAISDHTASLSHWADQRKGPASWSWLCQGKPQWLHLCRKSAFLQVSSLWEEPSNCIQWVQKLWSSGNKTLLLLLSWS